MRFACGSRLVTDGYDLLFAFAGQDGAVNISMLPDAVPTLRDALFSSNTKWLKASKDCIVFTNI
jgi:hypothetical protein